MVTKGNPDEDAKVPHIDDLSPLDPEPIVVFIVAKTQ